MSFLFLETLNFVDGPLFHLVFFFSDFNPERVIYQNTYLCIFLSIRAPIDDFLVKIYPLINSRLIISGQCYECTLHEIGLKS